MKSAVIPEGISGGYHMKCNTQKKGGDNTAQLVYNVSDETNI